MRDFYEGLIRVANFLRPLFLLALRLFFGWQFFVSGWSKLNDISSIAGYLASLHIPFPTFSAYLAALAETIGGLCLLVGFASRLVAIPLMITMLVAMATAHHQEFVNMFTDPLKLVGLIPFVFFLASLIIFIFGPGSISIDALLSRKKKN